MANQGPFRAAAGGGLFSDQVREMRDAALGNQEDQRRLVRSRGLEPPRVAPLAPQASASTTSATTADGLGAAGVRHAGHVTNRSGGDKAGRTCGFRRESTPERMRV